MTTIFTLVFAALGVFFNYKAFGEGSMEWIITCWVLMGVNIGATFFANSDYFEDVTIGQIFFSMVGFVVCSTIIFSSNHPTHTVYGIFYVTMSVIGYFKIWNAVTTH